MKKKKWTEKGVYLISRRLHNAENIIDTFYSTERIFINPRGIDYVVFFCLFFLR